MKMNLYSSQREICLGQRFITNKNVSVSPQEQAPIFVATLLTIICLSTHELCFLFHIHFVIISLPLCVWSFYVSSYDRNQICFANLVRTSLTHLVSFCCVVGSSVVWGRGLIWKVDAEVTCQVDPRLEEFRAVWARDGGSYRGLGAIFTCLPALLVGW